MGGRTVNENQKLSANLNKLSSMVWHREQIHLLKHVYIVLRGWYYGTYSCSTREAQAALEQRLSVYKWIKPASIITMRKKKSYIELIEWVSEEQVTYKYSRHRNFMVFILLQLCNEHIKKQLRGSCQEKTMNSLLPDNHRDSSFCVPRVECNKTKRKMSVLLSVCPP